ncbi:MAG: glycosyltransferase, partial [Phyllobacterium sp.]
DNGAFLAQFDAFFVQRTALSLAEASQLVDFCKENNKKLIFEIDDDLFEIGDRGDTHVDYKAFQMPLELLARNADLIVTSTELLADRLRSMNPAIFVSRNALSDRLWFSPVPSDVDFKFAALGKRDGAEVRIVYMGTKTHAADLALLEQPMQAIRRRYPRARLLTIGVTGETSDWYEAMKIPNGVSQYGDFVPWFRQLASQVDFAVAPLVGSQFNVAKSPLKFYDYAGAGLCGLFSNVEPYKSEIEESKTGYLVENTTKDWTNALLHAIESGDEVRTIAAQARKEARAHNIRDAGLNLDAAIIELCGDEIPRQPASLQNLVDQT